MSQKVNSNIDPNKDSFCEWAKAHKQQSQLVVSTTCLRALCKSPLTSFRFWKPSNIVRSSTRLRVLNILWLSKFFN